eukprot:4851877-Prymnesium_polylepis.4
MRVQIAARRTLLLDCERRHVERQPFPIAHGQVALAEAREQVWVANCVAAKHAWIGWPATRTVRFLTCANTTQKVLKVPGNTLPRECLHA